MTVTLDFTNITIYTEYRHDIILYPLDKLAEDIGVADQMKNYLSSWYRKYEALLDRLGIHL